MTLYEQISHDMVEAMKSHDKETLSTIRLLKSAIDLARINNKLDNITDELVIDVASKQVKTHKESIVEFESANRFDLSEKLKKEIEVISKYLPEQLSSEELENIINEVFNVVNPTSMKDMGAIMKELTPRIKGKADMGEVSKIIKSKLGA